jgi:hypothetical protein
LSLQGRQEFCEVVHGQIDPLGEVHERHGVSRLGGPRADLDDRGMEVRQQRGRHLIAFDRFRDAVEEPGFEGFGGIRQGRLG